MRSFVLAGVLLASVMAAALPVFEESPSAQACSCTDCDAYRDSDIVVRGTFTGWDYVRDANGAPIEERVDVGVYSNPEHFPVRRPVEMTLKVAEVFKGSVLPVVVVSTEHYDRYTRAEGAPVQPFMWPGEAGVCFAIGADPTGEDMIMALQLSETPEVYRLVIFPQPYSEAFARDFVQRFPQLGPPYPPSVGDSPAAETGDGSSSDWMFVSAIGAGFLLLTFVLLLAGPRRD